MVEGRGMVEEDKGKELRGRRGRIEGRDISGGFFV